MNEERMNPNFNLESCLRNKVNEAKIYLEDKHKRQKDGTCEESSYAESFIYYFQHVETILDLYQQEKEKNEKLVDKTIQYDKTLEKLQKDTIWKDKIREKIKEINNRRIEDGQCELALHGFQREAKIDVLKELLEEN